MFIPKKLEHAKKDIIHFNIFIMQYLNNRGFNLHFLGYYKSVLSDDHCVISYTPPFKSKNRVDVLNSLNHYFNWHFYEDKFIIEFNINHARKNVRGIKLREIF